MVSKCNGARGRKCKNQAVCFPIQSENFTMTSGTKGREARKILLEKYCTKCIISVPNNEFFYNRNMCSECQSSNGTYRITIAGVVTRYCDIHKPDGAEIIDSRRVIPTCNSRENNTVKADKRRKMTHDVKSASALDDADYSDSTGHSDSKSLSDEVNVNKRSVGSINDVNPKQNDWTNCQNAWV